MARRWRPCWLGGVVAGLAAAGGLYATARARRREAPGQWPPRSRLARDAGAADAGDARASAMRLHTASLAELAELMARAADRGPRLRGLHRSRTASSDGWEHDRPLAEQPRAFPASTVVRDDDGARRERFGAQTSGQTLLYGADGRLLFSGGTPARAGMPATTPARAAMLALLERRRARTERPRRCSAARCSAHARRARKEPMQ